MIWPFNRKQEPERSGVPADLSTAIDAAIVTFRDYGGEDGEGRLLVKVSGLGCWFWEGTGPAADRIQRHYPDLPATTCRRAARLLAATVAAKNRREYRQPRQRRSSWVFDF